jgi:hypothetical protein
MHLAAIGHACVQHCDAWPWELSCPSRLASNAGPVSCTYCLDCLTLGVQNKRDKRYKRYKRTKAGASGRESKSNVARNKLKS